MAKVKKKEKNEEKMKKEGTMKVKKIAEEWKIWDEEEEAAKSKEEVKKLVSPRSYKWIHLWKESKWKDADKENVELCDWVKG